VGFEAPLANLLTDFYDQLKSITSGYGSFNYELDDYRAEDLVKVDFYVAGERVDALSLMVHRSEADKLGRETVAKLKEVIPRQNFQVALQAAIGGGLLPAKIYRLPQRCYHRPVRRRRVAQKESPGQAKEGQRAHEAVRQSGHPGRSFYGDAQARLALFLAVAWICTPYSVD
jgi:GTP-binding protein LepA